MLRKFLILVVVLGLVYIVFAVVMNQIIRTQMQAFLGDFPEGPEGAGIVLDLDVEDDIWMLTLVDQRAATPTEAGPFEVDGALVVPADTKITVFTTSSDTLQPFSFPELGIDEDIVPGRRAMFDLEPLPTGEYIGDCGSFCDMTTTMNTPPLHVVADVTFQEWLVGQGQ